jgi:hypothetical protein
MNKWAGWVVGVGAVVAAGWAWHVHSVSERTELLAAGELCHVHHFDGAAQAGDGEWVCFVQERGGNRRWHVVRLADAEEYEYEAQRAQEETNKNDWQSL